MPLSGKDWISWVLLSYVRFKRFSFVKHFTDFLFLLLHTLLRFDACSRVAYYVFDHMLRRSIGMYLHRRPV
jgi:hypothetical protein